MELDGYLRATLRRSKLVISLMLLGGVLALIVASTTPVRYDAAIAATVQRVNGSATQDFQFDEYYALQSTDLVAQTMVSWFGTPSFVVAIYEKAGFDPAPISLNELGRRFDARKFSGQNVVVRFTQDSRDSAEKLGEAVSALLQERVPQLVQSEDAAASFAVAIDPAVITERKPDMILTTVLGLLVGLFVGLFLAAAREALSRETPGA